MECPACDTHIGFKTFCTSTKGTITCPSCKRIYQQKAVFKKKEIKPIFCFLFVFLSGVLPFEIGRRFFPIDTVFFVSVGILFTTMIIGAVFIYKHTELY